MAKLDIEVDTLSAKPDCKPKSEHVQKDDKVTWKGKNGSENWAVVFGPDAPFTKTVLTPEHPETVVTAKRPGDFHRHKYVVLVWENGSVKIGDPDLIVDE